MLVLLDGLLEFVNFLLEQHCKQVGHFRLHHVAPGVQQVRHELREHRGEMRVEGLAEHLDHVIPKALIQDVERYRLTADTGVCVLRCLRRRRDYSIACPDGLCRRRDLWGRGRDGYVAPRGPQKLTSHPRLSMGGNTPGLDTLHRRYCCEGGSALGMFPGTRPWCFERVSLWMWQDSRYGRNRGRRAVCPWHELFDHVEEYLGLKGFSEMHRHTHLVPFSFVIGCKT